MINVEAILADLGSVDSLVMPRNKTEIGILKRALTAADEVNPLTIYVGSCPDYSHANGLYTHESIGESVPLLTQIHLYHDSKVLDILNRATVPFRYIIMVADVEATDNFFCERFTSGDEQEFLRRCYRSVHKTQQLADEMLNSYKSGAIESSSFFREFGRERFLGYQTAYTRVLQEAYLTNGSFQQRVEGDRAKRMDLYRTMYRGVIGFSLNEEDQSFLIGRTLRTMAQYLALGRLITENANFPVIINHPTRNMGLFNDRNKFPLPDDSVQGQPTIPIFEMKQNVY